MMQYSKIMLLLFLAGCSTVSAQQQAGEVLRLNDSKTVHLEAGRTFNYLVNLKKGQFASIKLHQQSIGVGYAVYDPADSLINTEDANALYQTEVANIEATKTGNYRIEVFWDYGRPQKGDFTIVWDMLEPVGKTASLRATQLMNSWYSSAAAGAAVAVVQDGTVVYKSCKGLSNMEHTIPIADSSVFELASCSKQFTGFAIAMLIAEGKISLEDDIRKYLPELPDYGKKITIENLIYHTSGLRNWDAMTNAMGFKPDDVLTIAMVYKMICNTSGLNFSPGEKFAYTNTGYNLLALIVERVTGDHFGHWMKTNIFIPAGMRNTSIKEDVKQIIPHKVNSYKKEANGFVANPDNMALMGSTSVYSSINDLVHWVNYLETIKTGNAKIAALLNRKTTLSTGKNLDFYAFGNGFGNHKGVQNIEHLGLVSGFRTSISRYPEQRLAIIFLANDNNDASFARSWAIADLFLQHIKNKPVEPVVFPDLKESLANTTTERVQCPVDTKEYEGIYYAAEVNSHYKLSNKNGVLIATSYRFDEIALKWKKADSFTGSLDTFERGFEFERNDKNVISSFKLTGADKEIIFKKQALDIK